MANLNFNYIDDVLPTQQYEEYGVYNPNTVSFMYNPTTYSIQYIGVSSFEVNGTTYYDYNVYDAPVLYYPVYEHAAEVYPNNCEYGGITPFHDVTQPTEDNTLSQQIDTVSRYSSSYYDSISSDISTTSGYSINLFSQSFCTSVSYHNSFTLGNVSFTETSNSFDNYLASLNENVETDNENISCLGPNVEDLTDIKDDEITLEIDTESHSNTSNCDVQVNVHNYNENGVLQQSVEDNETDFDNDGEEYNKTDFDNDGEEHLLIHEENKVWDLSIDIGDDDTKEKNNNLYEECDNSVITTDERKILDWSVEIDNDTIKESNNDMHHESEEHNETDFDNDGEEQIETDFDNDGEEHLLIQQDNKVWDLSIDIGDDDTKEKNNNLHKESDNNIIITDERKILDWSVEIDNETTKESNNDMHDESDSHSFLYDEFKVLDWSVEVEEDDEDDSVKVNLCSSNDTDPYNSTDVVKYLKEELYRYALSGHKSLIENVPVVDILPLIREESESTDEDQGLEKAADSLVESEESESTDEDHGLGKAADSLVESEESESTDEDHGLEKAADSLVEREESESTDEDHGLEKAADSLVEREESESTDEDHGLEKAADSLVEREENIVCVAENSEVDDITLDSSQQLIESYDLVPQVEDSEEMTENISGLVEMNHSSVPAFYNPQENLTNGQNHSAQKDEMVNNEDRFSIKQTEVLSFKKESKALSPGEELELSVENAIITQEVHRSVKGNMPKLQKDSVNMMEQLETIRTKSLYDNDSTVLTSGEDEEIREEIILKKIKNKGMTSTTCHITEKAEHYGECCTKECVEKTGKSDEMVSSKPKKKKFYNLRKFLGNLCCWTKKKT